MNFPLGLSMGAPSPEQIEKMKTDARNSLTTTVAMQCMIALSVAKDRQLESPRATARAAFDLAQAFVDEHEVRGLEWKP